MGYLYFFLHFNLAYVQISFRELTVIEIRIESALGQQFFVVAFLDYTTLIHDKDEIRITNRRETMGNNEAGSVLHQRIHRFLNQQFSPCIDTARCFIKNKDRWIGQNSASNSNQLLLSL